MASAVAELIGYVDSSRPLTPLDNVSFSHKREFLKCVQKDRGGDWTQATLGIFALRLEAEKFPAIKEKLLALINDASEMARRGWDRHS